MHTRFGQATRTALSLAAAGLALAACSADAPTGAPGPAAGVASFTVTPAAHQAASASVNRMVRTFPTVERRDPPASDRVGAAIVNSPFDLTHHGGAVMRNGTSWNVYVNCSDGAAACWGTAGLTPAIFLRDLAGSRMIHVADQYLSSAPTSGFPVNFGAALFTASELSTTMSFAGNIASLDDVLSIVYAAYAHNGGAGGYTNIYHIFLPAGTDMCISPGECYSPDNWSTFHFCAFHGSVDFGNGQHVLFSVEPYQAVQGCQTPAQTRVIDATASTLSHEFFETITDPDLDAWWNNITGDEIGDLCQAYVNTEPMRANRYVIQSEYSNSYHACADAR
jgi:hypothetical protein